jgi:hypothetical protein
MPKKIFGQAAKGVRRLALKRFMPLLILFSLFLAIVLAFYKIESAWAYSLLPLSLLLFGAIFQVIKYESEKYDRGAKAEERVEEVLSLLNDNYYVLHDIKIGRGNIDHVVVAPSGIYTIETKSHKGKITASSEELLLNDLPLPKDFLSQAYAEAMAIKDYLKKVSGRSYFVQPILVFTNAFVEVKGKVRGVKILPLKWLLGELEKGGARLNRLERSAIANALKFTASEQ